MQTIRRSIILLLFSCCFLSHAAERIIYKRNEDRDLVMTIIRPPNWTAADRRAALIFFYNGGWQDPGATKPQFQEQAQYFAARGMLVAQADYREKSAGGVTSGKCVSDIFSAVRWLRGHASELGIDPRRIAAAGGSGSIHLPAAVFQVDYFDTPGEDASLDPLPGILFSFHPDPDVLDPPMMERLLSGGGPASGHPMPPTVVLWGSRDAVAPFLEEFVHKTRLAGLPVESFVGEGGVHGFYKFSPWLERTTGFMDQKLRSLGFLSDTPVIDLPAKSAPPGYEERILATQQRWLERHNELARQRGSMLEGKPVAKSLPDAPGQQSTNDPVLEKKLAALYSRFPEADSNRDGVLTWDEAMAYKAREQPVDGTATAEEQTDQTASGIAAFTPSRDWDTDRDGRVSKTEFKAPVRLFENMDMDGDGYLTGQETAKLDSKLDLDKTGETTWVVPPQKTCHGVAHRTYFSKAMQTEVGYNIYLPDGYDTSTRHYPVIYHLHGSGGNESSQIDLSVVYHKAIEEGKMVPVILVFVNGGRRSYYCDSADGKILSETTIIQELIPHIDATYRTIPQKSCRVLHGFSMGGFGSLKLGMKYPGLFGVVLSFGGGMAPPESVHMLFLKHIVGEDHASLMANNPADIAMRNRDALRDLPIWLFTGTRDVALEDSTWAHEFLLANHIAHRFEVSKDVGHALKRHYDFFGEDIFHLLQHRFESTTGVFEK